MSYSPGKRWRLVQWAPEKDSQSVCREARVTGDLVFPGCFKSFSSADNFFFYLCYKSDFFFVLQDTEVQKELSASNDDLPESNSTKVSSRMQHRLKVELS